jgi:hypothetical protein
MKDSNPGRLPTFTTQILANLDSAICSPRNEKGGQSRRKLEFTIRIRVWLQPYRKRSRIDFGFSRCAFRRSR